MKKTIILLSLAFSTLMANATTRVVNNRTDLPVNPGQYTTIHAAVTASVAGDTILVAGSANVYSGTVNINKRLTIIGPGYNPIKQNPLIATIGSAFNLNAGNASGTSIMGFDFSGQGSGISISAGVKMSNIVIRRNYFDGWVSDYHQIDISDSTINLTIAENYFSGQSGAIGIASGNKGHTNFNVINNIFTNSPFDIYFTGALANIAPITFSHNIVITGSKGQPLISSYWRTLTTGYIYYNMIVSNNIFYNTNGSPTSGNNFTYNNNITFAGAALPLLPPSGSVGSGNINNTDPQFVSMFNTTNSVDFNLDNLRLQPGSPAHNAATDGTDIGPTGGTYPIYQSTNTYLTGEPTIPEIKSINFVGPSSTQPGGTLQLSIKAKKIN